MKKRSKILSFVMTAAMLASLSLPTFTEASATEYSGYRVYVSLNGNDANDGSSLTDAVRTPERAQEIARHLTQFGNSIEVIFTEGVYEFDDTLKFTSEDSGSEYAPVIYRAYDDAEVSFTMGKPVEGFEVSEADGINASAKGYVYEADLTSFAEAWDKFDGQDYDTVRAYDYSLYSGAYNTLYQNGEMMSISNEGNQTLTYKSTVTNDSGNTLYSLYENNESSWVGKDDILLKYRAGTYRWSVLRVSAEGTTDGIALNAGSADVTGDVLNTLYGVDEPGEYYLDDNTNTLYFYPKYDLTEYPVYLAAEALGDNHYWTREKTKDIIDISGTSNLYFENIDFFCGAGKAFNIADADNIRIYASNIKGFSKEAIEAENTTNLLLAALDISDLKGGAVNISGGEQVSLTASDNEIRNCKIYDGTKLFYTGYGDVATYAIGIDGVGTIAANNEIYNFNGTAISFSGNDHLISCNRIGNCAHNDVLWDVGTIYSGRSVVGRGSVVSGNYIYKDAAAGHEDYANYSEKDAVVHNSSDNVAIYLDDLQSGITVENNIIYNYSLGAMLGGGSNNVYSNNYHIECKRGIDADNRGESYGNDHILPDGEVYEELKTLIADEAWEANKAQWEAKYEGFTELLERLEAYDAGTLSKLDMGKVYGTEIKNNVYAGMFADWWENGVEPSGATTTCPTHEMIDPIYDYSVTDVTSTNATGNTFSSASAANITVSDLEISGAVSTASVKIEADDYSAADTTNDYLINEDKKFVVIAAIYDGNDKLVAVQTFDEMFESENQEIDIDIDIPENAENGWYVKIMLWDSLSGVKPVSKQMIII